MSTVKINAGELGARLRADAAAFKAAIGWGISLAAERGKRRLKQLTPVDQGLMKAAWEVVHIAENEYMLDNSAPYGGIIEAGARPHGVSREGVEAIEAWVRRKILSGYVTDKKGGGTRRLTSEEKQYAVVDNIVWAIIGKLKKFGQKPTWFVRDSLPILERYLKQEIETKIESAANREK